MGVTCIYVSLSLPSLFISSLHEGNGFIKNCVTRLIRGRKSIRETQRLLSLNLSRTYQGEPCTWPPNYTKPEINEQWVLNILKFWIFVTKFWVLMVIFFHFFSWFFHLGGRLLSIHWDMGHLLRRNIIIIIIKLNYFSGYSSSTVLPPKNAVWLKGNFR